MRALEAANDPDRLAELAAELDRAPSRPPGPACDAVDAFRHLGRLDPALALGRLLAFLHPTDGRTHRSLARALEMASGPSAARDAYREAIAWRPRDLALTIEAGENDLAAGEPGAALDLALRAPAGPETARLATLALLALGRPAEALERVEAALAAGAPVEVRALRVRALREAGRTDEAAKLEAALEEDARRRRHEAREWLAQGNQLSADDRFTEAHAAYTRALEIDPALPEAYSQRALVSKSIFAASGDTRALGEGLIDFCTSTRLLPATADAILYNPLQLQALIDPGRVRDAIDRELPRRPIDPANFAARGFLLASPIFVPPHRPGAYEEALADFDLALVLDPGFTLARALRGVVHRVRGELGPARADLEVAFSEAPDVGMIRFHYACLEAAEGHAARTIELLGPIVDRFPAFLQRVRSEPAFDPIEADPEFARFLLQHSRGE